MTATSEPTEASPLIRSTSNTDSEEQLLTHVTGWTNDAIRTASLASAFLILYAFAEILKYISTVRLLELGICREHYLKSDPGLIDDNGDIAEDLCKLSGVQQQLAHLRGYLSALESIIGLLLVIPYGLVVERIGERTIAGINVVGYLLSCGWIVVVCFYWSVFPIWVAVLSPLFRVIGGGAPVLSSVIYAVAAKHVPEASRSLCFGFFMAAQLLTEIAAIMITALLLDNQFIFTPMLLNFPVGLLCIATLLFMGSKKTPEPLPGAETGEEPGENKTIDSIRRSSRILGQVLRNRNVLVLLATVPVARLISPVTDLMLQYIPRKFDQSLAFASRVLSIQALESLIVLLVILPILKNVAQVRFKITSSKVDLSIVQSGFLVMGLGCLLLAFSQTLILFILGLIVFTFGCSTRPALQSLLTDLIDREHIAVLYAVIAVGDGIGSAAGALILNRSLAIAIGWDDRMYLGLPFVIASACYMFGFSGSLFAGYGALRRISNE